jgi:hypothetical protein
MSTQQLQLDKLLDGTPDMGVAARPEPSLVRAAQLLG